jgi:hypothetical protein
VVAKRVINGEQPPEHSHAGRLRLRVANGNVNTVALSSGGINEILQMVWASHATKAHWII